MMGLGILVTLFAWASLFAVGEAAARFLFGPRYGLVATSTRLPLGVATSVCVLETAGYFAPIRVVAWLLLGPAFYGFFLVAVRFRRTLGRELAVVASSLAALGRGLVPVAIARRFTAAALTNNDSAYYVSAADRLLTTSWRTTYENRDGDIPIDQCLIERVLHWWHWRTGTPNLMAAVSTFSGLSSPPSLAVVTALLFACVPAVAIAIARGL